MGFFSWKTSDTKRSISNVHSRKGALAVHMILPDDSSVYEDAYEGYGEFGGKDFYAELAKATLPPEVTAGKSDDELRSAGISLSFAEPVDTVLGIPVKDLTIRQPRFAETVASWASLADSKNCPKQGYFY